MPIRETPLRIPRARPDSCRLPRQEPTRNKPIGRWRRFAQIIRRQYVTKKPEGICGSASGRSPPPLPARANRAGEHCAIRAHREASGGSSGLFLEATYLQAASTAQSSAGAGVHSQSDIGRHGTQIWQPESVAGATQTATSAASSATSGAQPSATPVRPTNVFGAVAAGAASHATSV